MIDPSDLTHPRNHGCARCGAKSGQFCVSKTGRPIIGVERQHAARQRVAMLARRGTPAR